MNLKQFTYVSYDIKGCENMIYSHNTILLKCKMSEIMDICGQIDAYEHNHYGEIIQTQKDKHHMLLSDVNSVFYRSMLV